MTEQTREITALFQKLDLFDTVEDGMARLVEMRQRPGAKVVSFMNAHAVNLSVREPDFLKALLQSDVLFRDGIGVKVGCKMLGIAPGTNLNGTDLIPAILDRYKSEKIAIFGAKPEWLDMAVSKLRNDGFDQLVAIDGYQAESTYLDCARSERPSLIVLAMGMPKQEGLALRLRDAVNETGSETLIVNGGAIIDFMSGHFHRAPRMAQKLGLEWAYRLGQEPGRLAKRYLLGNPEFLARMIVVRQKVGSLKAITPSS